MTETQSADTPTWCQSFHAGHNVHWIHARHGAESDRFPATDIHVADGWVTFTSNDVTYTRWSHNVDLIPLLREKLSSSVIEYCPRWNILYVETAKPKKGDYGSSAMFYLSDQPTDCIGGRPYWPLGEVRVVPREDPKSD